jgi:hypothetical protein
MAFYAPRYRYPLPRGYRRRRYPYRYYRRNSDGKVLLCVIAGAVLLGGATAGAKAVVTHAHGRHAASKPSLAPAASEAARAISFARSKVGKIPYLWGGTTDAGMDCSGLVQAAEAAAGVTIKRTAAEQWKSLPHVAGSQVVPGDLVFFSGADGTPKAPGHVGLVTGRHTMIDAYAAGTFVRTDTFGLRSSAPGLTVVVGYADPDSAPAGAASASAAVASGSEAAFINAVLIDLGAPLTAPNSLSLARWFPREYPSWPAWAKWNPMSSTLQMPGAWVYNTITGGRHVWNYPTASEGAEATALTLEGHRDPRILWYPRILAALRSGAGLCGNPSIAGELLTWSGGGYSEVC